MKIITMGSGSRLLFDFFGGKNIKLVSDVYRMNLLSMMSDPIDTIKLNEEIKDQFVVQEIIKNAWQKIISEVKNTDYIVIDLIDEKFDSLLVNDSYITYNYNIQNVIGTLTENQQEVVKNNFNDDWKESCTRFVELLSKIIPSRKIIIHEMYLAEKYKKGNQLLEFENLSEIRDTNRDLQKKYDFLKSLFNNDLNVIKIEENFGDFDHKYLLRPHLLNQDYYETFYTILTNTFNPEHEYYKIPFEMNDGYLLPTTAEMKFMLGGELFIRTYKNKQYNKIAYFSSELVNNQGFKLPKLKYETIYTLFVTEEESSLDVTLTIEFYDSDNKLVNSNKCSKDQTTFKTPSNFKYYTISLNVTGLGMSVLKNITLGCLRNKGVVSHIEHIMTNANSEDVHYYFEQKAKSPYLIVTFNSIRNGYEFVDEFESLYANQLHFMDPYGIEGVFFQGKNRSLDYQKNILGIIDEVCKEHNIKKEHIIMVGNFKSGGAALYYGLTLGVGNIIVNSTPIRWGSYPIQDTSYVSALKYVAGGIAEEDIQYLDNIILSIASQQKGSTNIEIISYKEDIECKEDILSLQNVSGKNKLNHTVIEKSQNEGNKALKNKVSEILNKLNHTVRIGVLGGCGSRDIFRIAEEFGRPTHYKVSEYYARTGIISMVSDPIEYEIDKINLKSNFRKRSLHRDLTKDFVRNLKRISDNVDYLIIDLMMERFDVLKYKNTYISNSWEYRESNIKQELEVEVLNRYTPEVTRLWEESCLKFISELKKYFKPEQIILNELRMVETYYKNNKTFKFQKEKYDLDEYNQLIKYYHQFFKDNFRGIQVIKPTYEGLYYCDFNHLWGNLPYHFNDLYYLDLESQISKINSKNK